MQLSLTGKVALVTGASGGLGEHFAGTLATAGASVVLAARRVDRLEALRERLTSAGGRAVAVAMDVTDSASVAHGIDEAAREVGTIDVVVNNAGMSKAALTTDMSDADWRAVIDTNLTGCFTVARETARRMQAAGTGGSIVNVASILGFRVAKMLTAYAAAKAGLIQATKAMALELARDGIRVNALAPGYVETDINRDFFATEAGAALVKRVPQRRLGRMEDLDGPLLLLASDAAAYMTGSVVVVDGGHLCSTL
ncbi:SDR family NAD(P)-dependent oxidoreductase [Acuticoccus sp.]|uniref:SDR family NAD(P)-dependent oxidoreductase n=1 Tax=Acuticoccus sp. TaxID=1904378 RepID=UPI003B51A49F